MEKERYKERSGERVGRKEEEGGKGRKGIRERRKVKKEEDKGNQGGWWERGRLSKGCRKVDSEEGRKGKTEEGGK